MAEQFTPTLTPTGVGTPGAIKEAGSQQQKANAWKSVFNVGTQLAGIATQLTTEQNEKLQKEKNIREVIQAQSDATQDMGDYSTRPAQETSDYFKSKRDEVITGASTHSDAYNKAYLSTTQNMYMSSTKEANILATDNAINVETSGMVNSNMVPEGYDYRKGLKYISDKYNVDPSRVRDSWMANVTGYYSDQYSAVNDMDSLAKIDNEYSTLRNTANTPELFGSRSANFKALDANNKTLLTQARAAAEKRIKTRSENRIVEATGDTSNSFNSYIAPLSAIEKDLEVVYGDNKITLDNKKQEYVKNHTSAVQSRLFQTQFNPGDVHTAVPKDNKQLQAEWQKRTTADLTTAFQSDNYDKYIEITNNESAYTKVAGEAIMTAFNNIETPAEMTVFLDKVKNISYRTNGATALRQSLGDENYVTMLATSYLAESGYAGDLIKARAAVNVTDRNISEIPMEPGMKADVYEYATKLGKQGDKYVAIVQKLHAIDPSLAAKEYKNAADFFEKQREERDGIIIDTSMSPIIDNYSIDSERTYTNMVERQVRRTGATPNNMIVVGDTVISLDLLSGTMTTSSIKAEAQYTNKQIEKEKQRESYLKERERTTLAGGAPAAIDVAGQVLIGQGPSIAVDFVKNIGTTVSNITSRFTGYLGAQWDKDVQPFRDWATKTFPNEATPVEKEIMIEATIEEFDNYINTIVTEDPTQDAAYNTMSSYDKETLSQTLMGNKHTQEVAKKLKKAFEEFTTGYLPPYVPPTTHLDESFTFNSDMDFSGDMTTNSAAIGLSKSDLTKLVSIESGNAGYTALNEGSGAYGKYQFIPSTAKKYAEKLGIKGDAWKTPANQDRMFLEFTKDNIEGLKKKGLDTDIFHIYGAHQQGLTGFENILKGNITPELERNMKSNLPASMSNLKGQELGQAWKDYWTKRLKT